MKLTLSKFVDFAITYLKCENLNKLIYMNFSRNIHNRVYYKKFNAGTISFMLFSRVMK